LRNSKVIFILSIPSWVPYLNGIPNNIQQGMHYYKARSPILVMITLKQSLHERVSFWNYIWFVIYIILLVCLSKQHWTNRTINSSLRLFILPCLYTVKAAFNQSHIKCASVRLFILSCLYTVKAALNIPSYYQIWRMN
jgi:hypothetical protein